MPGDKTRQHGMGVEIMGWRSLEYVRAVMAFVGQIELLVWITMGFRFMRNLPRR